MSRGTRSAMQAIKNRIAPILGGLKDGLKKKARLEKADQILLGLTHSGSVMLEQTLKKIESNPADVIGRVGRSVLERAQQIRGQMGLPPVKMAAPKTAKRAVKKTAARNAKSAKKVSKKKK